MPDINVEILENIISKLARGKSAGCDNITIEHLQYSHPIVLCTIAKVFNIMLLLKYVPNSFGSGLTIPIPKGDGKRHFDKLEDYRGITISSVLSKIFEMFLLAHLKPYLVTSERQYGF